ncbi:MAG: hypothetical protein IKZ13_01280 [Akkermansia sp.]|nr:hypothetical protein [Akkermansia sp.]
MSISADKNVPEEEDFADIEFRPRPSKQAPAKEEAAEKPTEPLAPATEAPTVEDKTEETPETTEKNKKSSRAGVGFDALLVVLLLAILGGGGYYIKEQMELYRVPTPMELALQDNAKLQQQRDELTTDYYAADEQIAMRQSLAHLDAELGKLRAECHMIESSISNQKNNILAMQHEIRTADKESRSIALSLLPGLPIGDATTTRGKSLRDAYIWRLEGKLITLRSPEGQIRLPLRELVKKDLPQIARYAFGEEDLIDMSDFDSNGEAPETTTEQKTEEPQKPRTTVHIEQDYEAGNGSPVIDTTGGNTISAPTGTQGDLNNMWDAPDGALPF